MAEDKKVPNPHGKLGGPDIPYVETGRDLSLRIALNTKKGLPVKRERVVIEEISKEKKIQIFFHPYNELDPDKNNEK